MRFSQRSLTSGPGVTTRAQNKEPEMMLKDKVAVIYGAGGDVGGAVARAIARGGAKMIMSGSNRRKDV